MNIVYVYCRGNLEDKWFLFNSELGIAQIIWRPDETTMLAEKWPSEHFISASLFFKPPPSAKMGQVLSTPVLIDSLVMCYRCPKTDEHPNINFDVRYSPMLSSVYDPRKIITISSSDSEWQNFCPNSSKFTGDFPHWRPIYPSRVWFSVCYFSP